MYSSVTLCMCLWGGGTTLGTKQNVSQLDFKNLYWAYNEEHQVQWCC